MANPMGKLPPFYLRHEPTLENDPANWLEGFETEKQAAKRHETRLRLISANHVTTQPNFYWCTPEAPCNSGACPKCMRDFRRWLVDRGITFFGQHPGPLCAASLVHHTLCRDPGQLSSFNLANAGSDATTSSVICPSLLFDNVDLAHAEDQPGRLPIVPPPALIAQQ